MSGKRRLIVLVLPLIVLVAGAVSKLVFFSPAPAGAAPKVAGEVYVLPKEFLASLRGGRYAKLNVALVLKSGQHVADLAGAHSAAPADGFGPLPQEALVRTIVTEQLTGAHAGQLTDPRLRRRLKTRILVNIARRTDVPAADVLITDLLVQ